MAIASMVLGICSVVFCWIPLFDFAAFIAGLLGVIFAPMAQRALASGKQVSGGKGVATAGLVLSIVGMILSALFIVLWILFFASEPFTHYYRPYRTWI